jgi:molybdopterin converting factor small subunit
MKITVKLFATLRGYAAPGKGGRPFHAEIADGGAVRDLVRAIGIPRDLPRIVMVNARRVSIETTLKDGDTVSLFPAIGGG